MRLVLVLRQPQGVRGGQTRRTQERLLGDVRGVRGGGGVVTGPEPELHLPPGYWLDSSDPDVWSLRRPEGRVVPRRLGIYLREIERHSSRGEVLHIRDR